jgi:uncharacterized membrane protein YdfJ with MMPL/SSD domain
VDETYNPDLGLCQAEGHNHNVDLAAAVDAAIVRTLLVATATQLFGKLNYWMPG